jgi:hypothetical protein
MCFFNDLLANYVASVVDECSVGMGHWWIDKRKETEVLG